MSRKNCLSTLFYVRTSEVLMRLYGLISSLKCSFLFLFTMKGSYLLTAIITPYISLIVDIRNKEYLNTTLGQFDGV